MKKVYLLFSFLILAFTTFSQSNCELVPQVVDADQNLSIDCSPYSISNSVVVSAGKTLTVDSGVVVNIADEKYIDIRGTLKVNKGATFNMGVGSHIKTDDSGILDAQGTETDSITFIGTSWKNIDINNAGSTIKYAKILNADGNYVSNELGTGVELWWDWILEMKGSSIENSRISSSIRGVLLESASTMKNSKIHGLASTAMEVNDNSIATGNEIYDVNAFEKENNAVYVRNATFSSNRIYSSEATTSNWAISARYNSTVEYNSIGGSNGSHGAVGIGIPYGDNQKIRYNNIGGYTSNIVIHGQKNNLTFSGNTFHGEMNASTGQRNITIENGGSIIEGYHQQGDSYSSSILSLKMNLKNNYWPNTSDIPSTIEDYVDNIERKGLVEFDPKLTSASPKAPITIPNGLMKVVSSSDIILSWSAVTANNLSGYKIYSKQSNGTYTFVYDVTDRGLTSHTLAGASITDAYVITSYDSIADGTNDQVEGHESWYSSEFTALSVTLSASSSSAVSTIGAVSTYDTWNTNQLDNSTNNVNNWMQGEARSRINSNGIYVGNKYWWNRYILEYNGLITSLTPSTTTSTGDKNTSSGYEYLGQHNGHSYFKSTWDDEWEYARTQAIADGGYLAIINDGAEDSFLRQSNTDYDPWVGYYAETSGAGSQTMPGVWKWVLEKESPTLLDLRVPEASSVTTITASIDRLYSADVTVGLSLGGSATVTDDYAASTTSITIATGSKTGTATITTVQDVLDEFNDTITVDVASSTFATEITDQKIYIEVIDDDASPGVTLSVSEDSIAEAGGTSNLVATLDAVSGRDVTVNLVMDGTASNSDYTAGGASIDVAEILTTGLVAQYKFDGNANDETSNANNGTVSGASLTTDRFGENNSAYSFDGSNDYISIPFSSSLQVEDNITLNVWVNVQNSTSDGPILITAPDGYYSFNINDNRGSEENPEFGYYGAAAGHGDNLWGSNLNHGEWKMLTYTFSKTYTVNGTDTVYAKEAMLYVDGVAIAKHEPKNYRQDNLPTSGVLSIGSNSYLNGNFFKGKLDDIRIYNKVLTSSEVAAIYTSNSVQNSNASITITKGNTSGTLEIKGVDDTSDEANETIKTKIISAVYATETGDQNKTIVVVDDDATTVSLSVTSSPLTEGVDGYATLTATLDKASTLLVTVKVKGSGTASATDYKIKESNENIGEIITSSTHWPSSGGEPNNSGGEDYGQWGGDGYNDLPEGSYQYHILEVSAPYSSDISGYKYIVDYAGHSYYKSDNSSGWIAARNAAAAVTNGSLLVVSSNAEHDFLQDYLDNEWIGLYQDKASAEYSEPSGGWVWVNTLNNPEIDQVTIAIGSTTASFYVFAEDDEVLGEDDETLTLSFDVITNGTAGSASSANIIIKDNDFAPDASIAIRTTSIAEGTSNYSKVTATLSVATTQPVTVNLTPTGTASAGDYNITNDTIGVASSGLAAHYTFSGNANDLTGNLNNGTVSGATLTTDRHGNANSAYSFDGTNDYISVPFSGTMKVAGDITMSAWVNIQDAPSYSRIIRSPDSYYEMWLDWNQTGLNDDRWLAGRSGGQGIEINTVIPENKWKHVIYTYTGDTLRMYVDGQLYDKKQKSYDWDNNLPSSGTLYIGSGNDNDDFFKGYLDDIRIYSRALSVSEVSTLYAKESVPEATNAIVVAAGSTTNSIYISAEDDDVYEGSETLTLSIGSVTNGKTGSSSSVSLTLTDNDSAPTVTLTSDKTFIGESDNFLTATLTATASRAASDTIKVLLATSGTATVTSDFTLSYDTIFILPGATTGTVTVTAVKDEVTEADESLVIAVSSVTNATEDGDQSVTFNVTETSCNSVDKDLTNIISSDLTLFELCSPYTIGSTGIRINAGVTLTIEKNVVLTISNKDANIQVLGTLVIKEGATINMAEESYIEIKTNGVLNVEGTATDSVTFTGTNWGKNASSGQGAGIILNTSGSTKSSIKYAKFLNASHNTYEWMVNINDGSTVENSRISGSRYGVRLNNENGTGSTLKNSKIHNISIRAIEASNGSIVTGNEIYDVNTDEKTIAAVELNSATFSSNRIYESSNTTNNSAIDARGSSTIEYNTIGGSSGSHGGAGISIKNNDGQTIRYNNIGGYTSNLVIHGYENSQNFTFTGNTFFGTMDTGSGQRNVTIFNGNAQILVGYGIDPDGNVNTKYGTTFSGGDDLRVNLENNYWGTTTNSVINASITDINDDFNLIGNVDYLDKLSAPSTAAPIAAPSGLTKAVSGSDVVFTWNAVTASDLNGYKLYKKESSGTYTLAADITNESLTTYTLASGKITDAYVITSYDNTANGTDDQAEGYESYYSGEFASISLTLATTSSSAVSTIGAVSTYDVWSEDGLSESTQRVNDNSQGWAVAQMTWDGIQAMGYDWGGRYIVEYNGLITNLTPNSATSTGGKSTTLGYTYIGQHNDHSYFRSNWREDRWEYAKTQAIADGGYLAILTNTDEDNFLRNHSDYWPFIGYYAESSGNGSQTMPGSWKWVIEKAAPSIIDIRIPENVSVATVTATIDKTYTSDVVVGLTLGGTATVTDDYTASATSITIAAGSTSGTATLTMVQDVLDEYNDTITIEVGSLTFATEVQDQKLYILVEDDDDAPGVTLTVSSDSISEAGGSSNIVATLDAVSGRDVNVNLVMSGTATSADYTAGGNAIDVSEILTTGLVAQYKFDGNSDDATSNNNDGTVSGAKLSTDRFGEPNSAYSFDGTNDYISVPFSSSLQIQDDITINVWAYVQNSSSNEPHLITGEDSYYRMALNDDRNGNTQYQFYGNGSGFGENIWSDDFNYEQWNMLTYTFTKTTNISGSDTTYTYNQKLYVDGVETQSESPSNNWNQSIQTGGTLYIGAKEENNNFFKGKLDDVRIYNKSLTSQEISTLYSNNSSQKNNAVIKIATGSTTGSIVIKGVDDSVDELDETVTTKIISTSGAQEKTAQEKTITIVDNDVSTASLTVTTDPLIEGGSTFATLTATLDNVSTRSVSVQIKGSGVDSTDYRLSEDSVNQSAGGLAAHYTFDGNADDVSGNNNNGTAKGVELTTDRFGKSNSAYYFDGVNNDRIEVDYESFSTLNIKENVTFNVWVSGQKGGGNNPQIYNASWAHRMDIYNQGDNSFDVYGMASGMQGLDGNGIIYDEWTMLTHTSTVTLVVNGSDTIYNRSAKMYINGVLVNSRDNIEQSNQILEDQSQYAFGNRIRISSSDDNSSAFKGKLDDIRIYSSTLSDAEVSTLYAKESAGTAIGDAITIPAGSKSGVMYVFAEDDNVFNEKNETLTLSIDSVVNGTGSSAVVTVTIQDNDLAPAATISKVSGYNVTEGKDDFVALKATLGTATTRDVSVKLKSGGEASLTDFRIATDTASSAVIPAAQYLFEGNANDVSGNNNNGNVRGAELTTDRFGNANSAYYFDGDQNDVIEVDFNSSSSLNISENITLNVWVNTQKGGGNYTNIINGNWTHVMEINSQGGSDFEVYGRASGYNGLGSKGIDYNVWKMLTFTSTVTEVVNGSDTSYNASAKIYVDGVLDNSADNLNQSGGDFGNGGQWAFGNRLYLSSEDDNSSAFKGKLDDISIYNSVLSDAQVAELYSNESSPDPEGNTIVVKAGSTTATVYVYAEDDDVFNESDELLNLSIDTVLNGTVGGSDVIQVNIKDNDFKPSVSLSTSTAIAREGSSSFVTLTATLDVATTRDVTVNLKQTAGDASISDYAISTNASDTIPPVQYGMFAPGEWEISEYGTEFGPSIGAGSSRGSFDFYAIDGKDFDDCATDDVFIFGQNDELQIDLGNETLVDDGFDLNCATPVAPYISGNYKYEVIDDDDNQILRVSGQGGYIGLPLVQETGGASERKYIVEHIDSYYMVLDHETSDGTWWRFTLQNMDYDGLGSGGPGGPGTINNDSVSVEEDNLKMVVPAGSTTASAFVIAIDDDVFDEPDESVTLSIDSVINGEASALKDVILTIKDNDYRPSVSLSLAGDTIREGTNDYVTLTATLDAPTTREVYVKVKAPETTGAGIGSIEDYLIKASTDSVVGENITLTIPWEGDEPNDSGDENEDYAHYIPNYGTEINPDGSPQMGDPGFNDAPNYYNYRSVIELTAPSSDALRNDLQGFYYHILNDSVTGHSYWESEFSNTWLGSKAAADSLKSLLPATVNAYLLVISSQRELDLLKDYLYDDFWVGLYQDKSRDDYSEPDGGWTWVETLRNQATDQLVIARGDTTASVYIAAREDNIFEENEKLTISIDSAYNGKSGSPASVDLIVIDNDDSPEVSISVEFDFFGESAGFNQNIITATLTTPISTSVQVPLTLAGTANASDYILSSDTIVINPGDYEGTVTMTALTDTITESNETIIITTEGVINASDSIKQTLNVSLTEDICSFVETKLSGNIFEDITLFKLCDPYIITDDLLIGAGATLTIQPGVTIEFEGPHSIKVDGGFLEALGTEQDSITIKGISWRGIDIKSPGSLINYTRIIDEGNSGEGDFLVKLVGSQIMNSNIYGSYRGVKLNDNSLLATSKVHDIRDLAIEINKSSAGANVIYDVSTDNPNQAAVMVEDGGFNDNRIYSTTDNPNGIAVQVFDNGFVEGNTIGGDEGLHGAVGILINVGYDQVVAFNRIGGYNTNVVLIGTLPAEFEGNSFIGELDISKKQMNVRVASGNMQESNQNYPGYIPGGGIGGGDYSSSNQTIEMKGNYWGNVSNDSISYSIYDYNNRADLKGNVDYSEYLTLPHNEAPIAPPTNLSKTVTSEGVSFKWSTNIEADLLGYKLYYDRRDNGTYATSVDLGNVNTYALASGNINEGYVLTAYDSASLKLTSDEDYELYMDVCSNCNWNQILGNESWNSNSFVSLQVSISSDQEAIAELDAFNTAVITATLTGTSPNDVVVKLTSSGTATVTSDYTLSSDSIVIKSGELSGSVNLIAVIDSEDEEDEVITVSIDKLSTIGASPDVDDVEVIIAKEICDFIENTISGVIREDMTIYNVCNPYFVTGNMLVKSGVTLTIEPGVTLIFNPDTYLRVNGTLMAEGTVTDSITFTGDNWKYIDVVNEGSSIKYAKITDKAEYGNWDYKVKLNRSSIENSRIYNVGRALHLEDSSMVYNSKIYNTTGDAMRLDNSIAYGNEIFNTSYMQDGSSVELGYGSVFRNNRLYNVYGSIAMTVDENTIIERNIFGDYSGRHGLVGLSIPNGNSSTIRYNKFGGFIANVVLVGSAPTFTRNSFIGEMNYSSSPSRNVVVGNNSILISDSTGFEVDIQGGNYGEVGEYLVNMKNNYWENVDDALIGEAIFDIDDNLEVIGKIVFTDELSIPDNNTPITPPKGISVSETAYDQYKINWNANTEADLKGYMVYSGIDLKTSVDVNNTTSYDVSIPNVEDFDIGLTAYDNDADGTDDQVQGYESWKATSYTLQTLPRAINDTLRVARNDSIIISKYVEESSIVAGYEFSNTFNDIKGSLNGEAGTWEPGSLELDVEFKNDRFESSNSALHLGESEYVMIPHDDIFNLGGDEFTLSFWFKLDSASLNRPVTILSKGGKGEGEASWSISHQPWSGLTYEYNFEYTGTDNRVYDTDWHYVSVVYNKAAVDPNDKLTIYFDGFKDSRNIDFNAVTSIDPLLVGARGYKDGIEGSVDDIILYDKALSDGQIEELKNFETSITVLSNDIDLDDDPLTSELITNSTNGNVSLAENGDVTYIPNTDYSGADSFTYRVSDGTNFSDTATVTISVSTIPIAADDSVTIVEDSVLVVGVEAGLLSNDSDPEGDVITVSLVSDERYHDNYDFVNWRLPGEPNDAGNEDFAEMGGDGFWTDANSNYTSKYLVEFNELKTSVAGYDYIGKWNGHSYFLSNDVADWNNANLLAQLTGGYLAVINSFQENSYVSNIALNQNFWIGYYQDRDAPDYVEPSGGWKWVADNITVSETNVQGDLLVNADGSFTYVPTPNFNGVTTFQYFAYDGLQYSDTARVTITVTPVDDAPVSTNDFYTILEDDTLQAVTNTSVDIPEAGIVVYYPFDANKTDKGPNNIELSTYGSPKLTADRFGNQNSAYLFDGEKDYMIGDASIFPSKNQSFSLSIWFYGEDLGNNDGYAKQLFGYGGGSSVNLLFDNPELPRSNSLEVNGHNNRFRTKYGYSQAFVNNNWHHVVLTYSSEDTVGTNGELIFYYDGKKVISNKVGALDAFTLDKIFTIGAIPNEVGSNVYLYPSHRPFRGAIDDVIVYSRVLKTEEITTLSLNTLTSVLANDLEVDGQTLTASLSSDPTKGSVTINEDGSFEYVPNANYYGVDSLYYVSSDGTLNSDPALVRISIVPVDDAPLGVDDSLSVDEDDILLLNEDVGVLSNDIDVDGDALTATLVSDVSYGVLNFYDNGSLKYTPNANYYGPDSFAYVTSDKSFTTDTINVTINVKAVNDAPVSLADVYSIEKGKTLDISVDSLGLLNNDSDIENDTLTTSVYTDASNGVLVLNTNGTLTYTPTDSNYVGDEVFSYITSDGSLSDTANVTITVTSRPIAVADSFKVFEDDSLSIAESSTNTQYGMYSGVLSNDSDPEGDAISAMLVTGASNGSLEFFANGSFNYVPKENYYGTEVFTYVITDTYLYSDTVAVVIDVMSVNDAPIGLTDSYGMLKNTTLTIADSIGVLSNDSDVDKDTLLATLLVDVSNGSLTIDSTGSFTYVPTTDYVGTDKFYYNMSDGIYTTDTIEVSIIVTTTPEGLDDVYIIDEDSVSEISSTNGVLANDTDIDSDILVAILVKDTEHGDLTLNADGSFNYVPDNNYNGTDNFKYVVFDGVLYGDDTTTVNITVRAVNDSPLGLPDDYNTDEGDTLKVDLAKGLLSNDSDIDSDSIFAANGSAPMHGTVTVFSDGSFEYIHDGSETTSDVFKYIVSDTLGSIDSVEVFVSIIPVNDTPIIPSGQNFSIVENSVPGIVVGQIDVEDENLQLNLAGTYPIITDNLWCGDSKVFEGSMILRSTSIANEYEVDIVTSDGLTTLANDYTFGGYYTCFNYTGNTSGDLRLRHTNNTIEIIGTSSFGETYSIDSLIIDSASFIMEWSNSAGLSARSTITRQDDVQWLEIINTSSQSTGFAWTIASGNIGNTFKVDELGYIIVESSDSLNFEERTSMTFGVTANDGVFTSDPVDVVVNIGNVPDMKLISSDIQNSDCADTPTGSISLVLEGAEGTVIANWTDGATGLERTDLSPGKYTVQIKDSLNQIIIEEFEIITRLIYDGVGVCYVTGDESDFTKNRIFVNTGPNPYNIKEFLIYREGSVAGNYDLIGTMTNNDEGFLDNDVDNRTKAYRYRVAIEDNCGNISIQSVEHVTNHLTANQGISGEINLIWSGYEGIEFGTYEIYRQENGGEYELLDDISSNNTSFSDFTVDPANEYKYYVATVIETDCTPDGGINIEGGGISIGGINIQGNGITFESESENGDPSYDNNPIIIRVRSNVFLLEADPEVLGIENEEVIESVENVYPNPTDRILNVLLSRNAGEVQNIEFIDFSGRRINSIGYTQNDNKITIEVSNLNSGIYLMNVKTEKGFSRVKVVIER